MITFTFFAATEVVVQPTSVLTTTPSSERDATTLRTASVSSEMQFRQCKEINFPGIHLVQPFTNWQMKFVVIFLFVDFKEGIFSVLFDDYAEFRLVVNLSVVNQTQIWSFIAWHFLEGRCLTEPLIRI